MTIPKAKFAGLALIAALCAGFTLGLTAPGWAAHGHPEIPGDAAAHRLYLPVIPEAVEEHVAPLGGQGLQDGETNAAGRSGDHGGFSFQHLGASSGVPCPESALQGLPVFIISCICISSRPRPVCPAENRPPAVHG